MLEKKTAFALLFVLSQCTGQNYIVELDQGSLSGAAQYDRRGGTFYSFKRIPYARPPVGEMRFKEPQPAENWDGILDATVELPQCPQSNYAPNPSGGEDCLYLNVYTPQIPSDSYDTLVDVMVYIHGGGFQSGHGSQDLYGPEHLIPENVVLVTPNYRLGIFGSFNLEDASLGYPGNLNMKDLVLALQWIRSNIAKFGGNPDSVTIFGTSAGGAAVHFLTLSPMAAGLFHKAIMQSGTALCSWALGVPNNGILLAEALGLSIDNPSEMIDELYRLTTDEINYVQLVLYNQLFSSQWPFFASPIVEQQVAGQNAFLTDRPLTLIQQGNYNHVPTLIGYNDADGISFHWFYTETSKLIPADLSVEDGSQQATELTDKMEDYYFASENFDEPVIQMYTDVWFGYPAYRSAQEHVKTTDSPVYFYRFSADTQLNHKLNNPATASYKGAIHTDERCYLFKSTSQPIEIIEPGSVEDEAINRLTLLWTNFAKFGDPTPGNSTDFVWLPISENTFNFVDFGSTETVPGVEPDPNSMRFWSEVYDEYGSNL